MDVAAGGGCGTALRGGGGGEGRAGPLLTCPPLQARLWLQACHFLYLNEGSCKCLPITAPRPLHRVAETALSGQDRGSFMHSVVCSL